MPAVTINERPIETGADETLLQAISKAGVSVPTLCSHRALTPYGACRLCIVEVHAPGRPPAIQASCSHRAVDGTAVFTHSDRVVRARRIVAELLLASCPDAEPVRRIAADLGVHRPRIEEKRNNCIYCGLCVRICEERMGRSAIGFSGRGQRKRLEPPFGRHNPMCWTCRACDVVCPTGRHVSALASAAQPVPIPNPHNLGLDSRPAVHILYPQAVPNKAAIDKDVCLHLTYGVCGICRDVCDAKAIDYGQQERTRELAVGAIVLSPGYEIFDARRAADLGYGQIASVVTALEFERMISASGPSEGRVLRPGDGRPPKRIAFIQCVGSRDADRDYCSSVCCMYATKQAILAKEHLGEDATCDIFFMDLRAFGKGFEAYYRKAQQLGVRYVRCRVPRVEAVAESGSARLTYLGGNDQKVSEEYDLVVLSVGMQPPKDLGILADRLGIALNDFSFCGTSPFAPARSSREGIFVAGAATEPKDIPETVMQGSAAAAEVLALLKEARGTMIAPRVYPPERDVSAEAPRIGVFVCHCGTNIAGVVNVPAVVEYTRTLSDVVYAEDNLYTCANDTQGRIKTLIAEHRLNRVVVASCTPRTHEPLFRNTIREGGLNEYLLEMANIRDQCSWVHAQQPDRATEKAMALVRMAVAKARLVRPLERSTIDVRKAALVVGGGLSGMTAALSVAEQGFAAYLVERDEELGGNLRHLGSLLNGDRPQDHLTTLKQRIARNPNLSVLTGATIESVDGSIGRFSTRVSAAGTTTEIAHGAVIVATGAKEYRPHEYLYGEDARVLTQRELEQRLAGGDSLLDSGARGGPKTVVMIQCVGSRDDERPYCSRVCCAEAIKNALTIKSQAPGTHVYVLYRDVRTYGFRERYYTRAREKGVVFVRYEEDRKPEVSRHGDALDVTVFDQTLAVPLAIRADLVVLSAGIQPHDDSRTVAQLLKIPVNSDGFFLEAHMKLRPVDFMTEGIFLCGLAHAPKAVDECILQAQAAAARAATVLAQDSLALEATISEVHDDRCDGCAYCIDTCPYNAITLLEYAWQGGVKHVVEIGESACKGCGCCQATCPKEGVGIRGFTLEQIRAQIAAALEVG